MDNITTRKLASIQVIDTISPIEGADRIEIATMKDLGWQCVVAKKDSLVPGTKIVYFEVDSILPEKPEYEFLRERHWRVKTIKLKKQVSQGLIIPVPEFLKDLDIGTDVTEKMEVRKHDPQAQEESELSIPKHRSKVMQYLMQFSTFRYIYLKLNSHEKGNWPSWLSKTDEERIQSCAKILINNYEQDWYVTEKADGQSGTFFSYTSKSWGIPKKKFGVCSRNMWLKTKTTSNYWTIAEKYNIKDICLKYKNANITIQGEIIGPKIQKNKYQRTELDFLVFNVFMDDTQLTVNEMIKFCRDNNLKYVPVLNLAFNPAEEIGTGKEVVDIVKYLVAMSQGNTVLTDSENKPIKQKREGIVIRLVSNPRVSFKVINPEFLLEIGE